MPSGEAVHPARAEVDLGALAHNYRQVVRRLAPGTKVIAAVKGDAYGHGAVACAARLAGLGADMLATGDVGEAVAMRAAGIEVPILIFGGFLPAGVGELLCHGLTPTVYDLETADAVSAAARRPTAVWVKVDCGLRRLGVGVEAAAGLIRRVAALPRVTIGGVYTHLPFADAAGRARAAAGIAGFEALVAALGRDGSEVPMTQARASAAVLTGLPDSANAVCVGHLLYGLSPLAPGQADMADFRPVLAAVRVRLIHVATQAAGRGGAAGGPYGSANAAVTGVVPVGLHHGMRGAAAGRRAEALVRGRRVPVIGVSLEHTTLDLGSMDAARPGEEVFLLGGGDGGRIAIEEVADWRGCAPLEVAMGFSRRLPFAHSSEEEMVR